MAALTRDRLGILELGRVAKPTELAAARVDAEAARGLVVLAQEDDRIGDLVGQRRREGGVG